MEATSGRQRPTGGERADSALSLAREASALEAAGRFLAEGRYQEAADALLEVQRTGNAEPAGVPEQIVAAARQMCLACLEQRSRTERHRAALNEAVRSEGLQRTRARALLGLAAATADRDVSGAAGDHQLLVRCLGSLAVEWEGAEAPLAWPSRRGKTLFEYLVLHRDRRCRRRS